MKQYKTILVALMFTICGQLEAEDLKATSKVKLRNKSKESAIKVSGEWIHHYETYSNASINYRLMKPLVLNEKKSYPVIVSLHGAGGRGSNSPV